ncbi:MAG TPA: DUF2637 domain-containing protein [Streptosporangiaceae bacterium]|nr:DUF2637 domain-containing protein [Streptosporangiaceae bacterium]
MHEPRTSRPADHLILIEGNPKSRGVTRPAPAPEGADKWISRAATVTVLGLAGIAGAISYSHMYQLAAAHGDIGWHAHAFPLSVDGVEIVASLVLLADRRAGRKSGWLPWAALAIGTAASLAANIATADHGTISRIIAGWPAVALLIAVKLLTGILEHRNSAARERIGTRASDPARPSGPRAVPGRPAGPGGPTSRRPRRDGSPAGQAPGGTVPGDIEALEQAARAARDELHRDGRPLTRDALATRLRAAGHPVRNARLTPLLATLRAEPAPTT